MCIFKFQEAPHMPLTKKLQNSKGKVCWSKPLRWAEWKILPSQKVKQLNAIKAKFESFKTFMNWPGSECINIQPQCKLFGLEIRKPLKQEQPTKIAVTSPSIIRIVCCDQMQAIYFHWNHWQRKASKPIVVDYLLFSILWLVVQKLLWRW